MKKRIVSLFLAVVMIVGMLPLGAISAFAEGTEPDKAVQHPSHDSTERKSLSASVPDYFYIENIGTVTAEIVWKDEIFMSGIPNLEYRIGDTGDFAEFTGTITLGAGEKCYFKGTNDNLYYKTVQCSTTGASLAIGGDIGTLLNETGNMSQYPENAFLRVFSDLNCLIDISDLTLCRADTVMGKNCFNSMFVKCKGLTSIPENLLPATTLAEGCYASMFSECKNLTSVPENLLSATVLAENCYNGMFFLCTDLTEAPVLPAEELCDFCYYNMFNGCDRLSKIVLLFTQWGNAENGATFHFLPSELSPGVTLTVIYPAGLNVATMGDNCIPADISVKCTQYGALMVTFETSIDSLISSQFVAYNGKITRPDDPTAKGYTFEGWYKDKEGTEPWDFENDIVTASTKLYAKWTKDVLKPDTYGRYHIRNAEDWETFDSMVKDGNTFAGETVLLDGDITITNLVGGFNSNPDADRPFAGTFDGQGNTITIDFNWTNGSDKGAFSHTNGGAVIKNLTVDGEIKGDYSIGGIVGNASATTFLNCTSNVNVTGAVSGNASHQYAGGIAGYACNGTVFENCVNNGNVVGNKCVGGIVGRVSTNKSGNYVSALPNPGPHVYEHYICI